LTELINWQQGNHHPMKFKHNNRYYYLVLHKIYFSVHYKYTQA